LLILDKQRFIKLWVLGSMWDIHRFAIGPVSRWSAWHKWR